MKKEKFGDKELVIRKLKSSDLKEAKKFQEFFNSFIREDAKLFIKEEISVKKQKEMIEGSLAKQRKKEAAYLVARDGKNIAGRLYVALGKQRAEHVATLGALMIGKDYRRMGLAKYLIKEAISVAKNDLRSSPKVIKISAFSNNEPALRLYEKKMGFKRVATIPKQLKYKGRYVDEVILLKFFK